MTPDITNPQKHASSPPSKTPPASPHRHHRLVSFSAVPAPVAKVVAKSGGKGKFLIDGFSRMDQAERFEESVVKAAFVLFFNAPEDVMMERLVKNRDTSGRPDDNVESIRKRFRVLVETSMPVADRFEKEGRVVRVKATQKPENVYEDFKNGIEPWV